MESPQAQHPSPMGGSVGFGMLTAVAASAITCDETSPDGTTEASLGVEIPLAVAIATAVVAATLLRKSLRLLVWVAADLPFPGWTRADTSVSFRDKSASATNETEKQTIVELLGSQCRA
mmetsp:Transcript_23645/g.65620  ORF Transcript_23645/g.65620 Transcript_23645/m.65620 type:complete len:119 (+) Transcript_23645:1217-1573(+)